MKRTYKDYALDIVDAMMEIKSFTKGLSRIEFAKDKKTINAVIRSLEVMGEAAKRISEEIRKQHPSIPWRRMAGFRDKLIHEYSGLDLSIIWAVVQDELPPLELEFDKLLKDIEAREE